MSGFIGTNFSNYVRTFKAENFEIVDVKDEFFLDKENLSNALLGCDILVHMAGASRSKHDDVYEKNIGLTHKLIDAMDGNNKLEHAIFLSSVHEARSDGYGRAKKESRELLAKWCKKKNVVFTGLVLPNVFGPFSKPFHNSAIATFCHQLIANKKPKIDEERLVSLLYVENVAELIFKVISEAKTQAEAIVAPEIKIQVSEILAKLQTFKEQYIDSNIIPSLPSLFDVNLFNTFCSFMPDTERLRPLDLHKDARGYLCEALKTNTKGQVFYSRTNKGITRGNHFHTRKIERFCVLEGRAEIAIRRIGTSEVIRYKVNGSRPAVIDMPIWYSHSIKNLSDKPLVTMFWTNEIFNPEDQDTYYEQV